MKTSYVAIFWSLFSVWTLPLRANVTLPAIISEHAVFQKTDKAAVWGKADAGEKVTVTLDGTRAETTTGPDGKWKVLLDLSAKGPGPFELTVEGKNKIAFTDILVGQAWVCSGQSNMEFMLKSSIGAEEEIANSANPMLRQFLVQKNAVTAPADDCKGEWVSAGPDTSGSFTAVGYYFGKRLSQEFKEPVGLISTYWGGSSIEAWLSGPAMDSNPDLKASKDRMLDEITTMPQRLKDYEAQYKEWETKYSRQDKREGKPGDFAGLNVNDSTWEKVTMPSVFTSAGLPDTGAVWVRRTVMLPPEMEGQWVRLDLGVIGQFDEVYWNGEKAFETTTRTAGSEGRRSYGIGGKRLKAGENVVAIRVFSPLGNGGFIDDKAPFKVGGVPLSGEWSAKVEYELPALPAGAKAEYPKQVAQLPDKQHWPTCLFNGMIHPIAPYAITGVIWYQGETNTGRAYQYRISFPTMIQDWRSLWGQGDFPFYYCQLANFMQMLPNPAESSWAELREAQSMALSLPNTGQAILIDAGEEGDIHWRNKKEAGDRLSVIALAKTYGKTGVAFSGPVYDSVKFEGDKAVISFKYADGGLVAKPIPATYQPKSLSPATKPFMRNAPNGELEGFTICGPDRQWKWANAWIEKESVVVSSPDVATPIAVRYGWANNPICNLYNQAGLPACPFRTDDFPGSTISNK